MTNLADSVSMTGEGDVVFTFHSADLEHLDAAASLLRKHHKYTAAQRVDVVRAYIESWLRDDE